MEKILYGFAIGFGSVLAEQLIRAVARWLKQRRGGKGKMVVIDW